MLKMQKPISDILKSVENIEKLTGKRKQIPVKYIDTSIKCVSTESMGLCKNPDCSWFNHSQVGLR